MLTVYPANPTLALLHLSAPQLTMRHVLISSSFQMEKRRHRLTEQMRSLQVKIEKAGRVSRQEGTGLGNKGGA